MKRAVTAGLVAGVIAVPIASVAPTAALASSSSVRHAAAVAHVAQLPAGAHGSATFTLTRFVQRNGRVYAQGVVRAVNLQTHQTAVRTVSMALQPSQRHATANATAQTCTILDLTLGPLHLDLLGLVIDLNQVHLVITAQQGPGNLLGNLLCALANLLNPKGTGLVINLNQLLGLTPA